jgi:uncharacterized membrane protein
MTAGATAVAILCQLPLVAGQVFLKHAMQAPGVGSVGLSGTPLGSSKPKKKRLVPFIAGIACLSLWFFVWLGLLQHQELSRVFPFEGLNPALMVVAAWLFLKERIPPAAWVGVALVCVGIALVSGS